MYINKGSEIPSEENNIAKLKLEALSTLNTLNNEDEKEYMIMISCKKVSNTNNSPYNFFIRTVHNENLIESYLHNEIKCVINENESFCDFLIMHEPYTVLLKNLFCKDKY